MFRTTLIAASLSLSAAASQAAPLTLSVYHADANSFNVSSVLVSGEKEAVLIDTGFTRADAYRIAASVLDSGKTLKTIYVSQADPDYYFGAEVLHGIFPQAQIVTNAPTLARIRANVAGKVGFWGPKMGANAPVKPVLPTALNGNTIDLEGQKLEIRGTTGLLAHRSYLWIPSIRAIVGNVGLYAGLHAWTADTQSAASRKAWLAQLDEMETLHPQTVISGHMRADAATDVTAIRYTRDYLKRFEQVLGKAHGSADVIRDMKAAYPDAGMELALDIGAKVNTGEMKW